LEDFMRSIFVVAAATILTACASQSTAPAPAAPAAAAPAAEKKAPQCWNGDAGAFQAVGAKAVISGVAVECKPTSDGKSAQWMSAKH